MPKMKPVSAYEDSYGDDIKGRTENAAMLVALQMVTLARIERGAFRGMGPLAKWAGVTEASASGWRKAWRERYGVKVGREEVTAHVNGCGVTAGTFLVVTDWGYLDRERLLAYCENGAIWEYARGGEHRLPARFDRTERRYAMPGWPVHRVPLGRHAMVVALAEKRRLEAEGEFSASYAIQLEYLDAYELDRERRNAQWNEEQRIDRGRVAAGLPTLAEEARAARRALMTAAELAADDDPGPIPL